MTLIDVTSFRIDGDEATFRSLDVEVQTQWAYQQPGLVSRSTGRNAERWLIETRWFDDDTAAAAEAAATDALRALRSMMTDIRTERFRTLE